MNTSITTNILTITDTEVTEYKYIHVVQLNSINGVVTKYTNYTHESSVYTILSDGYYKIIQLKLPLAVVEGTYYIVENPSDVVIDPNGDVISIDELLSVDPTGTTIVRTETTFFTSYLLHTYYINLLKTKFQSNLCSCCNNITNNTQIDALTMGFALIDELVSSNMLNEAERIIELLNRCTNTTTSTSNCNCNG